MDGGKDVCVEDRGTEGWMNGEMEGWRDEGMEGLRDWRDGGMERL